MHVVPAVRSSDFPRLSAAILLVIVISGSGAAVAQSGGASHVGGNLAFRPADAQTAAGFNYFYNLDYDHAIQNFEQVVQKQPEDAFAANHLLTAVLFKELYRMGALNTGDYANDSFVGAPHRPADPTAKQQMRELVDRAEKLEEKQLQANANDVDALYARGVTRAQFATYTALIERAWFSALRNAVGARRDHERVLELSPGYTDAKLIVGAHNYVMGSLPWGVKAAVSIVRLNGSKEKGIQYLREAAAGNGETSVDAKILLALFLRREKRFADALTEIRELEPRYPHNVLLALEDGNLLRADGKNPEAEAVYRKIWQAGRSGGYGSAHYEFAAFNLGEMLRADKNYGVAAAAYEQVREVPHPDPEVLQKADLAAGEMYDVLQKRELAVKKYEAVVATNASSPPADIARKRMKEPYRAN